MNTNIEINVCPLCSSIEFEDLYVDYEGNVYVKCISCSLVFQNPRAIIDYEKEYWSCSRDPDGILKAFELHDNNIGRSSKELIRKIKAAQFVRNNGGEVCPVNWEPGQDTLKPNLDLVGKI